MRKRLLGALLVSVATVLAAGASGITTAAHDLSQSQRLYRLSQLNTSAIALSHALADERDDAAALVAAGRSAASGHQISSDQRAEVDRQSADLSRAAAALDTGGSADLLRITTELRSELTSLPHIRSSVLASPGTAKAAFDAYSPLIDSLDAVSGALARALPDRAASPDTSAGPALARAVAQASAEHGLLVAALTVGGAQAPLVGDAQQARLREQAALADFTATASATAQTQYVQTVTGTDVTNAEGYLQQLTAKPYLTGADNALRTTDVDAALSARIERMRAVQASLAAADTTRIAALRNADVTRLELQIALVGGCMLLALGIGVHTARSLTRPLAALRRYAGDPQTAPPVDSRDEFAAVAHSIDLLGRETAQLREESTQQEAERKRLVTVRERIAAQRDTFRQQHAQLSARCAELEREKDELTDQIAALKGTAHTTFINLSLRMLALVERQLALIEGLEDREQDPGQLETLFRLDHLATRMRRNSESLLVLAGADTSGGALARPVPLLDVVRAAISEIERYERVQVTTLPRVHLAGFSADDASHLVAELMENATAFSPPNADVRVSGWLLENGEAMISVEDRGIGVPAERIAELNRLLQEQVPQETETIAGLGLYVVARLAARHGIRVQLREQAHGGLTAVAVLPRTIVVRPAEGTGSVVDSDPVKGGTAARAVGRGNAEAGLPAGSGHRRRAAAAAGIPVDDPGVDAQSPTADTAAAVESATAGSARTDDAVDGAAGAAGVIGGAAGADSAPAGGASPNDPPADGGTADDSTPDDLVAGTGTPGTGTPDGVTVEAVELPAPRASAGEPHEHARPDSEGSEESATARPRSAADAAPRERSERPEGVGLTAVGLPKRVPRASGLTGEPTQRSRAGGPVDAEALRRRLGGFAQGLREGRRDAEAEATASLPTPVGNGSESSEEARG